MKTEWDYTDLADAYIKRPDYASEAVKKLIERTNCLRGASVCDVGAGVGHLTIMLAELGFRLVAVEPNDAMRANGERRTETLSNVSWFEGTGEDTGQADGGFDLVTFGSSFNVTDRRAALTETARILGTRGWFACLWNHRDLNDPIQKRIESIILKRVPDYHYGTRREDQTEIIDQSGLFEAVVYIEGGVTHDVLIEDAIEAWRSHGTLERQSGGKFKMVVEEIAEYLHGLGVTSISVPYVTRIWAARKRQ